MSFVNALASSDALHVWVAGRRAEDLPGVAASDDGGVTWDCPRGARSRRAGLISFPDPRHGWAVGARHGSSWQGYIVATTDGGRHWRGRSSARTPTRCASGRVTFADARHGPGRRHSLEAVGLRRRPESSWRRTTAGRRGRSSTKPWASSYPVTCTDALHAGPPGTTASSSPRATAASRCASSLLGTSQALRAISFSDSRHGWDPRRARGPLLATATAAPAGRRRRWGPASTSSTSPPPRQRHRSSAGVGGRSVTVRGLSNKRIEQDAKGSAKNRQAICLCSCAVHWAQRGSGGMR